MVWQVISQILILKKKVKETLFQVCSTAGGGGTGHSSMRLLQVFQENLLKNPEYIYSLIITNMLNYD